MSSLVPFTAGTGTSGTRYDYDVYGNLLSMAYESCGTNTNGTKRCYSSGGVRQSVVGTTNRFGALGYDAAGNVTREGQRTYAWDTSGTMRSMTLADGRVLRYLYDASDERVAIFEATGGVIAQGVLKGKTTWTLRGPSNQVLRSWLDDSTSGTRQWSWNEDQVFRGGQLLANESSTYGTRHYSLDHLGSPRVVTNNAGSKSGSGLGEQTFTPFGSGGSTNGGALQFTGHERDAAIAGADAPDYMHARYYSAERGRFLSVDPAVLQPSGPHAYNRYVYAFNSPLKFVDPDGQKNTIYFVQSMTLAQTRSDFRRLNDVARRAGYRVEIIRNARRDQMLDFMRRAEQSDYVVIQAHANRSSGMQESGLFKPKGFVSGKELASAAKDGTPPSGVILAGCNTNVAASEIAAGAQVTSVGTTGLTGANREYASIVTLFSRLFSGSTWEAAVATSEQDYSGNECRDYLCTGINELSRPTSEENQVHEK